MRTAPLLPFLLVPALLATLGCDSKLSRSKAENLLRASYPVVVPVSVPEKATAEKGSPAHQRLTSLKENLDKTGWFDSAVKASGGQEEFTFHLKPSAPKSVKAAAQGFKLPGAEAAFVRAVRMEPTREGSRVTYEIRLEKPTAQFPILQSLFPDIKLEIGRAHV